MNNILSYFMILTAYTLHKVSNSDSILSRVVKDSDSIRKYKRISNSNGHVGGHVGAIIAFLIITVIIIAIVEWFKKNPDKGKQAYKSKLNDEDKKSIERFIDNYKKQVESALVNKYLSYFSWDSDKKKKMRDKYTNNERINIEFPIVLKQKDLELYLKKRIIELDDTYSYDNKQSSIENLRCAIDLKVHKDILNLIKSMGISENEYDTWNNLYSKGPNIIH